MKKRKVMNFNITKLFTLFLGVILVVAIQATKTEANTANKIITMDTDITMTLDGANIKDKFASKVIRAVNAEDDSIYYTKALGKTSFPIVDGTYNLYDITNKSLDASTHETLKSNGTLTVKDGEAIKANMEFFTVSIYADNNESNRLSYQEVLKGNKANEPKKPTKTGYTFIEWVDEKGNKFDFNTEITAAKKIYPRWEKKYAIVVVAGQSNAVGYDESNNDLYGAGVYYNENDRVNQLGLYGDDNLKIIPLGKTAQNFQDMRTFGARGIHLPLGNLLLEYISEEYDIVIIPAAYGGTGFTTNKSYGTYDEKTKSPSSLGEYRWGVESAYYKTIVGRISYLLDKNPDNYYIGTVWCQGEHDGANPEKHKVEFEKMTKDFFDYFNKNYEGRVGEKGNTQWSKDQWFIYESVPYWTTVGQNSTANGVKTIFDNYKTWNTKTYVDINFNGKSREFTNETNGANATKNGNKQTSSILASHYGNGAFARLVAPSVVNKMVEAGAIPAKANSN